MEGCATALYFFEDIAGLCSPDEWFGCVVMMGDVCGNFGFKFGYVMKTTATNSLGGEIAKEARPHGSLCWLDNLRASERSTVR